MEQHETMTVTFADLVYASATALGGKGYPPGEWRAKPKLAGVHDPRGY